MHLTNLHTHTIYCDGKCKAEEMIQSAINCNFQSIGISTHGPVPFVTDWNIQISNIEKYIDEVNMLKEKYKDEIYIFLGMELDYIPNIGFSEHIQNLIKRLDYYIGSVHYLGKFSDGQLWTVDYNLKELLIGIQEGFSGNIRHAIETYYSLIAEMAVKYQPPVIGHIDLVKKNNKNNLLFDEKEDWYNAVVERCLDVIKNTSSIIEINTGGMARGYTTEQYPSNLILKMIQEKNIKVIINSDAHTTDGINFKFNEMYNLLKELGIKNTSYLTKNGWACQEI